MMDEFLTITAASGLIAEKQLSAVELTAACLDRARRRDGTLRAFILPTPKRAMAHAHAAEARVMAGLSRGPLDGILVNGVTNRRRDGSGAGDRRVNLEEYVRRHGGQRPGGRVLRIDQIGAARQRG